MKTHLPFEKCSPYIYPGLNCFIKPIDLIVAIICKELNLDINQVRIRTRITEIRRNRQIIMHCLRWYGWGSSSIGRYFNYDHATVIHSYRTIFNDQLTDKNLKKTINHLYDLIKK
jgi:chromosomal replication initiation ATPase DnaA